MNDFIKEQQELALKELDKYWEGPSEDTIREVIQQIITNTGEELIRLAEEEKSPYRPNDKEFYNDTHRECGYIHAKNTIKQHITSLTGAK